MCTKAWFFAAPFFLAFSVRSQPAFGSPALAQPSIWWEGESAAETNFPQSSPFASAKLGANAELLSGGDWLSTSGKRGNAPLFARYSIDLPAGGRYALWARKFWKHGPFQWRFDGGEWQECGPDVALADSVTLKKFVSANWVSLGPVTLTGGKHRFELQLLATEGQEATAAFDCFVLSSGGFVPSGKTKPGEKSRQPDEGFFAYDPPADPFRPDALLDLRPLNEAAAGQSGFIKRREAGFTLGDGTPTRFWAVNIGPENIGQDRASVDYLARKLAKVGVNMVRFHGPLYDAKDPTRIDPKRLDNLLYCVAAMKKQGIYTYLSFYFPLWIDAPQLGLGGYDGSPNKHPFGLLFFDTRLQTIHQGWARQILSAKNPYTGLALAQDPALGIVEIQNEDSLFFWTFTQKNIPPAYWEELERRFATWLTKRYGSVQKAQAAWEGTRESADAAERAVLYEASAMTRSGLGGSGRTKRIGDQVHFLAELERDFYAKSAAYLKTDLKFGGLVNTCNWTVADANLTGAIERWAYTPGDMIDTHGYFNPEHKGEGSEYSVRVGHTFVESHAVSHPGFVPLRFQQIDGFPQIMTELGFTQPNRFRADAVFLSAAYASLQGVDGLFFFTVDSNYLNDAGMRKFQIASPAMAGTFPAAALAYRRGDIKESSPAVFQVLNPADLFAMKGAGGWAADAMDAFRAKDLPAGATIAGAVAKMDDLAPYAGPVVRSFGSDTTKSWQRDLSKLVDHGQKTITSLTGELVWNYRDGVALMNTPRAQGAAGFLGKGAVETTDVKIALGNDFGAVTVISLDSQPIAASKRLLIQVMTQEQPMGFTADGKTITDLGSRPFELKQIGGSVAVKFATAEPIRAFALDENGYSTAKPVNAPRDAATGWASMPLLPDVLYYVIAR